MSLLAGERPVLFTHRSLPCQFYLAYAGCRSCIAEPYKAVCLQCKAHTQHTIKQYTVNPLIAQMLTPSCPVPLVQCQCFLLALITVLVSLGISVIPSQLSPVSEFPPQSCYETL
ncbi:unnamed protein product, partial [Staurois parvus]